MQRDPRKLLDDMRDRAQFVHEVLAERTLAELEHDRVLRSAIERELMVLGEALMQLHRLAPEKAEQIERWKDIIGFRHILVHGYDVLDMQIVWDIAKNDVPKLIEKLKSMLAQER